LETEDFPEFENMERSGTENDTEERIRSRVKMWKIVIVGLLSVLGSQGESSFQKGGKSLTAEDSIHVVAEAHASGGDTGSSPVDPECEKCKAFVDFLRVSIEQGDTDVEKKAIEMCSSIASEDVCSEFKGKVKDMSESNFGELVYWLGVRFFFFKFILLSLWIIKLKFTHTNITYSLQKFASILACVRTKIPQRSHRFDSNRKELVGGENHVLIKNAPRMASRW